MAGPNPTIADYIKQNDIQETAIKMGDPSAPAVNLPIPDGWQPLTPEEAPDYAYGAIGYGGAEFKSDPPNIVALMSKLTGTVDQQKIIDLAPGELNNLPDYKPGNAGEASTLGDYPAYVLGGTYTRDGATRVIAQKTVVIPVADGLYVLQLNVDGPQAAGDVWGQPPTRSTATPPLAERAHVRSPEGIRRCHRRFGSHARHDRPRVDVRVRTGTAGRGEWGSVWFQAHSNACPLACGNAR